MRITVVVQPEYYTVTRPAGSERHCQLASELESFGHGSFKFKFTGNLTKLKFKVLLILQVLVT